MNCAEANRLTVGYGTPKGEAMHDDRADATPALSRLEALVGEWTEQVANPSPPGRMVFEWALGAWFIVQRSEIPHPDCADSMAIIAVDANCETYTQHYFDSRGVVRVYKMSLNNRTWTLLRDGPDFTPLEFSQRFTGTFADDGQTINATWETAIDGVHWEKDFDLEYTKVVNR
jgi:hypothetical protein